MATDKKKETRQEVKSASLDDLSNKDATLRDKMASGVQTAKKVTTRIIIAAIFLAISGFLVYANINFSEGNRVGKVVKLSKKGVMFKTWEGELQQEDNPDKWEFSIQGSQEQVRTNIDEAIEANKRVKLFYKEKYITFPWRGDTKYLIYKVEVLEK